MHLMRVVSATDPQLLQVLCAALESTTGEGHSRLASNILNSPVVERLFAPESPVEFKLLQSMIAALRPSDAVYTTTYRTKLLDAMRAGKGKNAEQVSLSSEVWQVSRLMTDIEQDPLVG